MNRYRFDDESHVHTLDGQPLVGTSRVGSILAKPLAWYGSGKAVEVFGVPDPKVLTKIKNNKATKEEIDNLTASLSTNLQLLREITIEEYAGLIDKAYRAHDVYMRSRAKPGKDLHSECERFVKDWPRWSTKALTQDEYPIYDDKIRPFIAWASENVKRFLWSEGHCYSEKHWIGGISDAGYETQQGKFGILDFKSSKEAYMDQFWQCAGYAIQVEENGILDKDGNQLLEIGYGFDEVCVFPFGGDEPKPYFHVDIQGAKEAFLAELFIYNKLPKD